MLPTRPSDGTLISASASPPPPSQAPGHALRVATTQSQRATPLPNGGPRPTASHFRRADAERACEWPAVGIVSGGNFVAAVAGRQAKAMDAV